MMYVFLSVIYKETMPITVVIYMSFPNRQVIYYSLLIGLSRYTNLKAICGTYSFNGSQLAKMKKSIPDMSLPWNW